MFKKYLKDSDKCPGCGNTIERSIKLKLINSSEIRCPFCAKDLGISSLKALLVTGPLYILFGLALYYFTDLSKDMAMIASLIFVALVAYPSRRISVLASKLEVIDK